MKTTTKVRDLPVGTVVQLDCPYNEWTAYVVVAGSRLMSGNGHVQGSGCLSMDSYPQKVFKGPFVFGQSLDKYTEDLTYRYTPPVPKPTSRSELKVGMVVSQDTPRWIFRKGDRVQGVKCGEVVTLDGRCFLLTLLCGDFKILHLVPDEPTLEQRAAEYAKKMTGLWDGGAPHLKCCKHSGRPGEGTLVYFANFANQDPTVLTKYVNSHLANFLVDFARSVGAK